MSRINRVNTARMGKNAKFFQTQSQATRLGKQKRVPDSIYPLEKVLLRWYVAEAEYSALRGKNDIKEQNNVFQQFFSQHRKKWPESRRLAKRTTKHRAELFRNKNSGCPLQMN